MKKKLLLRKRSNEPNKDDCFQANIQTSTYIWMRAKDNDTTKQE